MNNFLPIEDKKIGILGAGLSGLAAAELAHKLGANVFVTDFNKKNKINIKGIELEYRNLPTEFKYNKEER